MDLGGRSRLISEGASAGTDTSRSSCDRKELMKTERSPFRYKIFLGDILWTCGFCKKKALIICVYIYIYTYIFLYSIYIYIIDFEIHKMHELKGSNLCFAVCRGPNPL